MVAMAIKGLNRANGGRPAGALNIDHIVACDLLDKTCA